MAATAEKFVPVNSMARTGATTNKVGSKINRRDAKSAEPEKGKFLHSSRLCGFIRLVPMAVQWLNKNSLQLSSAQNISSTNARRSFSFASARTSSNFAFSSSEGWRDKALR